MENSRFEFLEEVCANTSDGQHFLIIQAKDQNNDEIIWAAGDDHVCAVAHADFIRNQQIQYNDVLIKEFPYRENTPDTVGEWKPLILELVQFMLAKYLEHDGMVHVYPQWLPEDLMMPGIVREALDAGYADHVILYDNNIMEIVPRSEAADGAADEDLHPMGQEASK